MWNTIPDENFSKIKFLLNFQTELSNCDTQSINQPIV